MFSLFCCCFVFFVSFNWTLVFAQKPCDGVLGQQFRPDPRDCRVYHLCGKGKDWTLQCGPNLVWNQKLGTCVPIGSANDTCSQNIQSLPPLTPSPPVASRNLRSPTEWRYSPFGETSWRPNCPKGSKQRFAHPTKCAQYYDCGADPREDWFGKNLRECLYPTLFDTRSGNCGYYTEVDCGKRQMPLDPCDYMFHTCRTSHCAPCFIKYASCAGMRNGVNVWRGREKTPFFVVCFHQRVVFHGKCVPSEPGKRQVFDQQYNTCVRPNHQEAGRIPTIRFNGQTASPAPLPVKQGPQIVPNPGPHKLTPFAHSDIPRNMKFSNQAKNMTIGPITIVTTPSPLQGQQGAGSQQNQQQFQNRGPQGHLGTAQQGPLQNNPPQRNPSIRGPQQGPQQGSQQGPNQGQQQQQQQQQRQQQQQQIQPQQQQQGQQQRQQQQQGPRQGTSQGPQGNFNRPNNVRAGPPSNQNQQYQNPQQAPRNANQGTQTQQYGKQQIQNQGAPQQYQPKPQFPNNQPNQNMMQSQGYQGNPTNQQVSGPWQTQSTRQPQPFTNWPASLGYPTQTQQTSFSGKGVEAAWMQYNSGKISNSAGTQNINIQKSHETTIHIKNNAPGSFSHSSQQQTSFMQVTPNYSGVAPPSGNIQPTNAPMQQQLVNQGQASQQQAATIQQQQGNVQQRSNQGYVNNPQQSQPGQNNRIQISQQQMQTSNIPREDFFAQNVQRQRIQKNQANQPRREFVTGGVKRERINTGKTAPPQFMNTQTNSFHPQQNNIKSSKPAVNPRFHPPAKTSFSYQNLKTQSPNQAPMPSNYVQNQKPSANNRQSHQQVQNQQAQYTVQPNANVNVMQSQWQQQGSNRPMNSNVPNVQAMNNMVPNVLSQFPGGSNQYNTQQQPMNRVPQTGNPNQNTIYNMQSQQQQRVKTPRLAEFTQNDVKVQRIQPNFPTVASPYKVMSAQPTNMYSNGPSFQRSAFSRRA